MGSEVELDNSPESLPVHLLRYAPAVGGHIDSNAEATRRIVFLHGFSQNASCVGDFVHMIRWSGLISAIDLPGHGGQGPPTIPAETNEIWRTADRIAATTGYADYIGYSMGGRIALHLALAKPDSVGRLVLIGATAGIDDPILRSERRTSDEHLATRMEQIGLRAFTSEWLNQPLFRSLPASSRFIDQRNRNDVVGLAWSLRTMGTGTMEPLWGRLRDIVCPVLVIAGGQDERYCELAQRLVGSIGTNAELSIVDRVGHSVHLEAPGATADVISDFLERTGKPIDTT